MGISNVYNSIGSGISKVTTPLKNILSSTETYTAPVIAPKPAVIPRPVVAQKPVVAPKPIAMNNPEDAIYQQASQTAKQKYGVEIPPYFLKAVRQQESSGIVNPNDYGRSFGLVNAGGTSGAKAALGNNYLPDTSLANSAQNAANYAASRAQLKNPDGSVKVDLSTPENLSKLYVQRYVGLLPGETRVIGGQKVSYDKVKSLFEQVLKIHQQ